MTENEWRHICKEFSQINANVLISAGSLGEGQKQIRERLDWMRTRINGIEAKLKTIERGFPEGVIP